MKKNLFFLLLILSFSISNSLKAQTTNALAAGCITSESFTLTVCDSLLSPSGKTWDTTGVYLDTILNTASCDSIMFFDLTVLESTTKIFTLSVCDSLISPTGKVWNTTGTFYDTLPNTAGCDSLLTYNLTIGQQILDTIIISACDSLISPTGKKWSVSGIYSDTIVNAMACDTILIFDLTIVLPTTSSLTVSVCDSLISPTGKVWNTTGTFYDTLVNANSCDSILTYNLTVGEQILDTVVTYACDSLISPSGKKWITTGIYNDTIINVMACDSLFVFDLTIGNTLITVNDTVCDSTISPSGITTYTATGVYQDTLFSVLGCDSIVYTINLQVYNTNHDTVVIFNCDTVKSTSSSNMWTTTGIYVDTVFKNINGCDSTISYNVTIGKTTTSISTSACNSYLSPAGNTYTTSGVYYDTLISDSLCDSIFVINLTINNVDSNVNNYQGKLIAYVSGAAYKWLDCNNSLAVISGAISQEFIPASPGTFALQITRSGCVDTSSCYIITSPSGINKNSFGANFNVYPNPTTGLFTVNFNKALDNAKVTLVDVTGKVVLAKTISNTNSVVIDTYSLDKGTYFVTVENNNQVKTISIVKQ
jgi:hypothetical protein